MKILVVEDETKTGTYLKQGLIEAGFVVDLTANGLDGLHLALTEAYDLAILDVMLPGIDGWQVLQGIRRAGKDMPVLFLTARDQVEDRVKGLEAGADDYLVKPFAFEELLARLNNLANRQRLPTQRNCLHFADLELDLDQRQLRRAGRLLNLTGRELDLIELLMRNPQKVLSRERVLANVWSMNEDPLTNVVDVYIRRLRNKIDKDYDVGYLRTLRGTGYYLSAD